MNPKDADVFINRGNTLNELAQFEKSVEDYGEAIRLNPNYSEAYHNRGVAYNRLGNYEDSERDFAKVAELRETAENGPSSV